MVEQCHFTYVTKFKPTQEQICDENFEKKCQITFKQQGFNETVKKCYKPVEKVGKVPVQIVHYSVTEPHENDAAPASPRNCQGIFKKK
jgi:hypothetical protein